MGSVQRIRCTRGVHPLFIVGTTRGVENAHHLRRSVQLLRCARGVRPLAVVGTIRGVDNAHHLRRGERVLRRTRGFRPRHIATPIHNNDRPCSTRKNTSGTDTREELWFGLTPKLGLHMLPGYNLRLFWTPSVLSRCIIHGKDPAR